MNHIGSIMTGTGRCGMAGLFAYSLILTGMAEPLAAQTGTGIATASDCARSGNPEEELACLRAALEAREALDQTTRRQDDSPDTTTPQGSRPIAKAQLGAEQLGGHRSARDDDGNRPLIARITQSQVDHLGRLTVRLDNGQTWQQAEPNAVPLRLRGNLDQVEISRSGFGGYRLRLPELGRRIAVRRID